MINERITRAVNYSVMDAHYDASCPDWRQTWELWAFRGHPWTLTIQSIELELWEDR